MYNNDIRVANTATPLVGETNVSQYGWTTSDRQAADQMITYVDQCKTVYNTLEEKLLYVENLVSQLESSGGPDGLVLSVNGKRGVIELTAEEVNAVPKEGVVSAGSLTLRTLEDRFSDYYNLKDFGAKGDGVSDDTVACRSWVSAMKINSRAGYAPEGSYLTENMDISNIPGLTIVGSGYTKTVFIRKDTSSDTTVMRVSNCPGSSLKDFKLDGRYSVTTVKGSGLQLLNCKDSIVDRVWSHDMGSLGILAIHPNGPGDDLSYLVPNVHITRCVVTSTNSGGIQMVGHINSGISQCFVKDVATTGIYFKCPVESCYSDDNSVVDSNIGFSIGSDYGTTQKAVRMRMSNLSAKNTVTTARFGNMLDSVVTNISGGQSGVNTDGIGDGVRLENSERNIITNVSVSNIGSSRSAARFTRNSIDNTVELSSSDVTNNNSYHAGFAEDCTGNRVVGRNPLSMPQSKRVDGNIQNNTFTERRIFKSTFTGEKTKTITHNLKWSNIPFEEGKISLSQPSLSFPGISSVDQNSFSISFSENYTGDVVISF